jgi:menaquinone-dependent protoporphyrinogen oxidase
MTRVLVAYGSKHGATAEIAEAIADELRRTGVAVDRTPAGEVADLSAYDAVVLGSAVYMKRWRGDARRLLHRRAKELGERPLWLFSSGPIGEDADLASPWCSPRDVLERAARLGARDHRVFGGRVPLDPANFMARAMQRDTSAEHSDLRDWEEIREWARGIAAELAASRAGVVA